MAANRGFNSSQVPMSNKQCLMAYDFHRECLADFKTLNDYICPDTFAAYKRWCPDNIRHRFHVREVEDAIDRKTWTQEKLDALNTN